MNSGDLFPALRRGSTQKYICDHSLVLQTTDLSGGARFSFHNNNNNNNNNNICVCVFVNCSLRIDRKKGKKKRKCMKQGNPPARRMGTGWH